MTDFQQLLSEIRACEICKTHLPYPPKPVLLVSEKARLLIVGQAPGTRVQETGIPWNDPSGEKLRSWLGMDKTQFYEDERVGIVPMGFCYPGKGKSGDLPPRPECAKAWREKIHAHLPNVKLTLLIGKYAQDYYLKAGAKKNLTETIKNYEAYLAMGFLPLVHPSPRNFAWHLKNQWFEYEVVPVLREKVAEILR